MSRFSATLHERFLGGEMLLRLSARLGGGRQSLGVFCANKQACCQQYDYRKNAAEISQVHFVTLLFKIELHHSEPNNSKNKILDALRLKRVSTTITI
jgi:hypothetical protein